MGRDIELITSKQAILVIRRSLSANVVNAISVGVTKAHVRMTKSMPVIKCPNGKYRIGGGKCIYKSKASAVRAYKAYLAKNPGADETETLEKGLPEDFENEWVKNEDMKAIFNAYRRILLRRRNLPKEAYWIIPAKKKGESD